MRPELLRKIIAKLDSVLFEVATPMSAGSTEFSEKRKKSIQKGEWRKSPQFLRWETRIRNAPDKAFGGLMLELDAMTAEIHKALKNAAANVPKNRGGREALFSLKQRKEAIHDLGKELTDGSNYSKAVETVAKRHSMGTAYVRSLWKNRARLNRP